MNETNLVINFNRIDTQRGSSGDLDYCLHELAHYVVLFRKPPCKRKDDIEDMNMCLETMTCGRAQLHELRVIRLQFDVLKIPLVPLINSVWWGIEDAGYQSEGQQKSIVTSKAMALRRIKAITVSPRLMRAYSRTIERFSA